MPPLYKIKDDKNPFIINKEDYINRYVKEASKSYKVGYIYINNIEYMDKGTLIEFLSSTSFYTKDILTLSKHYKVNDRLLEIIMEEFSMFYSDDLDIDQLMEKINIQHMIDRIAIEFPEIYYSDKENTIKGIANGKRQAIELSDQLIRKSIPCIKLINKWRPNLVNLILRNVKTGSEDKTSLLGILKILAMFQPDIIHRFKGLGENSYEDIKTTLMDPNTRTLIRVNINDIENDMKVFQMLRGQSPLDALNRKTMIRNFKYTRADIDT